MKENKEANDYINFLKKQPEGFLYKENESNKKANSNEQKLEQIKKLYKNCQECPLANQGRARVVFGQGSANAKLMLIGEGPGRDEDKQGIPFIGRAGQLLTKIIEAMKLKREDILKLTGLLFFASAMGYSESAVVVYLRELYYKEGFSIISELSLKAIPLRILITEHGFPC